MKSANEMANDLLRRRDNYQRERAAKRRKMAKLSASLCAACLVLVMGLGLWQRAGGDGLFGRPPQTLPSQKLQTEAPQVDPVETAQAIQIAPTLPLSEDPRVLWATGAGSVSGQEGLHTWEGKEITFLLWETLEKVGEADLLAIYARPILDDAYIFQGKTLGEYDRAMSLEKNMPEYMTQLLKEGDALKYGTALYETGTPQGERWTKEWYEERVAFYGDLLPRYIVDGQFLKDKLEQDLAQALVANTEKLAWERAVSAFLNDLAVSHPGSLVVENDRCLVLFLTGQALRDLSPDGWLTFDLAAKTVDGSGVHYSAGDSRE